MDSITKSINEKNQAASSLLPSISALRSEVRRKLSEYNFMTYQLLLSLFKNINYDPKMDLANLVKKFMLNCPFVSFNDIFDPTTNQNKTIQNIIFDIYNRTQRSGFKGILYLVPVVVEKL